VSSQPAARVAAPVLTDEQLLALMTTVLAATATTADVGRDLNRARGILNGVRALEAARRGDINALPKQRPAPANG
jgi:hypothetical protein